MNKVVFLISLYLFSFGNTFASESKCYDTLTQGENFDSRTFTMNVDVIDVRDFGRDHLAQAIAYVRVLLDDLGCSKADVNFGEGALGRSSNRCVQISNNREYSRICFVETNLGYFFVSRDFLTGINVVYNRWD